VPKPRQTTQSTTKTHIKDIALSGVQIEQSLGPNFGSKGTLHGSLCHVEGPTNMLMKPPPAVRRFLSWSYGP
jgi:hypothetical protein